MAAQKLTKFVRFFLNAHADMTAVTIQSNTIISKGVRQLSTSRAIVQKKVRLFGKLNKG